MNGQIRGSTVGVLREVLADRGRVVEDLGDARGLFADGIGLDSLDFATVVVRLQQAVGVDPFGGGQVAQLPRTVGELIAIYERAGAPPGIAPGEDVRVEPSAGKDEAGVRHGGPAEAKPKARESAPKPGSSGSAQGMAAPSLTLRHCSVEEHCRALVAIKHLPFWWYLGFARGTGNFSVPFQDRDGAWWYQVKPGLSWPVDFLAPLPAGRRLPVGKTFLGLQYITAQEGAANSHLVINSIADLSSYGPANLDSKRRNAVRKGLRNCQLSLLTEYDKDLFAQCLVTWDELSQRTSWKHQADPQSFDRTWRMMLDCPGTSILVGRDGATGEVAGFLVTKIIGDTAYVDTIASRTAQTCNVNDALVYAFTVNARGLPGVTKGHFAIRSYIKTLEHFKWSMGYHPIPFPAVTRLRWPVRLMLRWFYPAQYRRMVGQFDEVNQSNEASCESQ
jgi:hypothetical protein